jgi:AcrR family transcriptional regulator
MSSGSKKSSRSDRSRHLERAQEKVDRSLERAQKQVDRSLERAQQKVDRAAEQADRAMEQAEQAREPLVWLREEPHSRRPSHTRNEIAAVALEIADAEGFDAVSMRRVAQMLGAGTMTLYHYVANKDELITLMVDEVMGELLVPEDELSDDWRTAMTQIATRTRDAFAAHRWTLDRLGDRGPGPNGMRHFEQSLRTVAGLGLDQELVFELIGQLDDYVFGYALREAQEMEEHERGWPPEVLEFFQREIDTGDYPLIREFLGDDADAGVERVVELLGKDGRFERGLNRLLDGIEAEIQS